MELTGRWTVALPLLIGASGAYLFTALTLKRSVLTEKVARRGFHLTREYDVDPLAILFVREVMDTDDVVVYDVDDRLSDVVSQFLRHGTQLTAAAQRQRIYPVTDAAGGLVGVVTRRDLLGASGGGSDNGAGQTIGDVMSHHLAIAYPDETIRDVAYRMAEHNVTRMPVIARGSGREIVGIVTLPAMLAGRSPAYRLST